MQSRVLTVGRLVPRKGQKYLVDAVKQLVNEGMNIKLTIIGKGPLKEELIQYGRGLDFEILSDVSENDVNKTYRLSDLFVLPSITDAQGEKEGLGMVLIEAISFRLPVIAFDNGGISEVIIDGETGMLIPEKDVDRLVKVMKKVLTDKSFADDLIEKAYNNIKRRFSTETLVKQQVAVYEEILEGKN